MKSLYHYLLSLCIISVINSQCGQKPITSYPNGQKNLYRPKDLETTVCNNLAEVKVAYENKNYRMASLLATGVTRYIDTMNMRPLDTTSANIIDFIIADCHINLKSPQLALSSFDRISDKITPFGTITSEKIAQSLHEKLDTIPDSPLSQKLSIKASYFKDLNQQKRIKQDTQKYSSYTIDQVAQTLLSTKNTERLSILASCYVALLSQNPQSFSQEQSRIQKMFHDNKQALQTSIHLGYHCLQTITNNNHTITLDTLNDLKVYSDSFSHLRHIIADLCTSRDSSSIIKKIKELELKSNFETDLIAFIAAEGDIVIPLLQSCLLSKPSSLENIHYFLGILFYHKKEYSYALEHFNLSKQAQADLLTQYRVLICNYHTNKLTQKDIITQHTQLLQKTKSCSKKPPRNKLMYTLLCDHLNKVSKNYIHELLNNGFLKDADTLINLLLQETKTASITITALNEITQNLNVSDNKDNCWNLKSLYSTKTWKQLQTVDPTPFSFNICHDLAHLMISALPHNSQINNTTTAAILRSIQETEKKALTSDDLSCVGILYYTLGKKCNSPECFDKALLCGNVDACYEKAVFLNSQPHTKETEEEIIYLLKKHASSESNTRKKSLYKLGQLYLHYSTQGNHLEYVPCNDESALHYLEQAVIENNKNARALLAVLYTRGIKSDEKWILQPDHDKALSLFQEHAVISNKFIPETIYHRAITYYSHQLFGLALQDLNLASPLLTLLCPNISIYKALALFKMSDTQDTQNQAITEIIKALNNPDSIDFSLINTEIETMLDEKIASIINSKDISPTDLDSCHTVGKLYCIMPHNTDQEKQRRARGIQYLQLAAELSCAKSQLLIGYLPKSDIPLTDSVKYLIQLYKNLETNQNILKTSLIQQGLNHRMPNNPIKQYLLFNQYCTEKKPNDALTYLKELYSIKPVIISSDISTNNASQAIKSSSDNTEIQQLLNNFLESPLTSTLCEKNATILLGSLYACSRDKAYLLNSVRYLEAVKNLPSYDYLNLIISEPYYQLALLAKKENNNFLFIEYLKKSSEYNHPQAQYDIAKEWTHNNPSAQSLPITQIISYVTKITERDPSENNKKLLHAACNKIQVLQEKQDAQYMQKGLSHPYFASLINSQESHYAKNKQLKYASTSSYQTNSLAIKAFEKLAQKNHPHACLISSVSDSVDITHFTRYFNKSLIHGIVPQKNKSALFVDTIFLLELNVLIHKITLGNNRDLTTQIISIIKNELKDRGVNMTLFKQFMLDTRDVDLDDYQ